MTQEGQGCGPMAQPRDRSPFTPGTVVGGVSVKSWGACLSVAALGTKPLPPLTPREGESLKARPMTWDSRSVNSNSTQTGISEPGALSSDRGGLLSLGASRVLFGSAFAFSSFFMYLNQNPSVGIFFSHNFFKLGIMIRTPKNSPFSSGRSGGPGVDWLLQFFLRGLVSVEPVWGSSFFLCVSPGREEGRPAFRRGCLRPVVPRWLGLCVPTGSPCAESTGSRRLRQGES